MFPYVPFFEPIHHISAIVDPVDMNRLPTQVGEWCTDQFPTSRQLGLGALDRRLGQARPQGDPLLWHYLCKWSSFNHELMCTGLSHFNHRPFRVSPLCLKRDQNKKTRPSATTTSSPTRSWSRRLSSRTTSRLPSPSPSTGRMARTWPRASARRVPMTMFRTLSSHTSRTRMSPSLTLSPTSSSPMLCRKCTKRTQSTQSTQRTQRAQRTGEP